MAVLDNVHSDQDSQPPPFGEEILTRPIDQAMLPFYHMTNFFLRKIIVRGSLKALNTTVNLADRDAVRNSIQNDWQTWITHYIGYFLVFLFSIVIAITIIIGGVIFCCCRRKGRCGSRINPMESNRSVKYVRWIVNGLCLILVSALLLASVGTFVTSDLIYDQTRETGTPSDILQTLTNLNNYSLSTILNLAEIKEACFEEGLTDYYNIMDTFPTAAQSDIVQETYIEEAINNFNSFVNRVPSLYDQLGYMDDLTQSLTEDLDHLKENITSIVAEMEISFEKCSGRDSEFCLEALRIAKSIMIVKDYQTVSNVSEAREGIISATQGNYTLNDTMSRTIEASNMIKYVIANTTAPIIGDIYHEVDVMSEGLDTFSNNTLKYIAPVNLADTLAYVNDTFSPNVALYDYYRFIAATILNSSILLVVSIFFIGLLFGACGSVVGKNTACCNPGKGGNVMIAGVITSFIVTWIIVLASGLLLIVGGFLNTEICNNLINPNQSDDIQVLDYILTSRLNSSINIRSVMNNCQENLPFYSAFEIPQRVPEMNISEITNLNNYNFDTLYKTIGEQQYNISLDLIDVDSINLYSNLEASFNTVDPTTYFDAMHEKLSDPDLSLFADYLQQTSEKVCKNETAVLFVYYSKLFRATARYYEPRIALKEAVLYPIVDSAYDTLIFGFQEYVDIMEERGRSVDSEMLQTASTYHSQSSLPELASAAENTSEQIQESAKCQTVYHSVQSGVTSICVKWLYPFNTYWFCLGSSFFFISLILFPALYLDNLYRKLHMFNLEPSGLTEQIMSRHDVGTSRSGYGRSFQTSSLAVINPIYIPDPDYEDSDETSTGNQSQQKASFSIGNFFKRKRSTEQRISETSVDFSQDFF